MEYKILADITNNFIDLYNIPYCMINGILSNYKFYTTFDKRPVLTSIVPDYFALDVFTTNIVLTFDKPIYLESNGIIFIKDMTNGVFHQIIDTSDSEDLSNNIDISDNVLTITPNNFY